ncbi:MAG TPA: thioesterase family protein [Bacteroidia bacterium]|jgi:acyl-CoA thioester hydrolase|nr:thioesterase family protein [Bacteroidia bacterium]HNO71757.1 thioesterase family protein [Bacteroidia bacterium]
MFSSETKIRVRYGETDRMGYAYYGNYAEYFEVARVEALRGLGISYKSLEDGGIMLPVYEFSVKYFKPAYYDDLITIKCHIKEIPKQARIKFHYESFNETGMHLNEGETTLVFINKNNNKPTTAPVDFIDKIKKYFNT